MLTADEKRRINDALTRNNGNRQLASAALNIGSLELKSIINNNKDLKALWGKKRKPVLTLVRSGDETGTVQVVTAETEAQIQARREQEFKKLLVGTAEEGDLVEAMSLQKAYGRYTEDCESLIGGTLVERGLKLKRILGLLDDQISKDLEAEALSETFTSKSILYVEAHKMLARIMEVVSGSRLARAKALALKEAGKSKGRGKTSFGPKTAIVAQNVMVGS